MDPRHTILCLTSYFKGNRFLTRCKQEGCRVILLTVEGMLKEPWPRDHLDEVFALPAFADRRAVINAVCYLCRTRKIDRLVALDDYDVELGAHLREHLRLPGMGDSTARLFRDKLAMRVRARDHGVPIPEFTPIFNHDDVRHFLATVPGPWLLKPRFEASSIGIKKLHRADDAWPLIDQFGDDQSFYLIERLIPGDLYHVDSLVSERKVVFAAASRYHRPLLDVYTGGGIYATQTLPREAAEAAELRRLNEQVLTEFRMLRGASHTEFMRAHADGKYYFIETSARVGGANIAEMVEAATGVNLWEEWARIEVAGEDGTYVPPTPRDGHGGVIVSLARQEWPDYGPFADPEVVYKLDKKHHVGLVVGSPSADRVTELLNRYHERIARDYHAALPPADKATS
jgi:hypothetical protein